MPNFRIAIFASGNGTNAEEIIKYFKGHDSIEVVLLLSNDPNAMALQRARNLGVLTRVFTKEEFRDAEKITGWLLEFKVTHVVLAGFLWLLPDHLLEAFPNRIINIHPALLPKFGGKGMFGMKVHEAVKSAGDTETGITIHIVNEHYDDGKVLFQTSCAVEPSHTPEEIRTNVNRLEYYHYPRVIERWIGES